MMTVRMRPLKLAMSIAQEALVQWVSRSSQMTMAWKRSRWALNGLSQVCMHFNVQLHELVFTGAS